MFPLQAVVALFAIVTTPLPAVAAAFEVPSPEEIFQRVFATNVAKSGVVSADAVVEVRIEKSLSDPPDCVFNGITRYERGRQTVTIERRSSGTLCWAANKYAVGQLFDMREALESVLPLLDLTVLGVKLVDGHRSYLIQGKARDPKTNLRELIVWADYSRGLLTEGTLIYPWGSIDVEQEYAPLNGGWVLTHQYIYTSRFHASMKISYNNFRVVQP
jgi:hypothetical protein